MRILILNWRDIKNPQAGGAEMVTFEYAKSWVLVGHEVTYFTSSFKGGLTEETIDGIRVIRRGTYFTVHLWAFFYFITNRFGKIDLIIDEFHFVPFFTPLYASGVKILAFVHEAAREVWFSNLFLPFAFIGFIFEPLFYQFYKKIPFITVSSSTKKDLINFGIPEKQIKIIYNGISQKPLKEFPKKEREPTLCYVGYLSEDKGVEEAILAFLIISQNLPKAKLWIIGRGEERFVKKIKEKVRKLNLGRKIKFWGFVPEEMKFRLVRRAHILLNPSHREGWGLVNIEANAMATPVIGYNVPGMRDSVKNGKTGILVERGDYRSLAESVLRLIRDEKRYLRFQKNDLSWSAKFSWEKAIKASLKLIESL